MPSITKRANSVVTVTGPGPAWSSPSNASGSDNAWATAATASTEESEVLRFTDFQFPVLDYNIEITGFQVTLEWHHEDEGEITAKGQLRVEGTTQGDIKSFSTAQETTDASETIPVSTTDLWGITGWTVQKVSASNFGIDLTVSYDGVVFTTNTAKVDDLTITMHYNVVPPAEPSGTEVGLHTGHVNIVEVVGY